MTPNDLLTGSTTLSPAVMSQESVSAALEAMLQQVADLKGEMLIHQQESDVLGRHTDENLAKIRARLERR